VELHVIDRDEAARIVAGAPLAQDRWHPEYPLADELDVLRPLAGSAAESAGDPVFGPMMIRALTGPFAGLAVGGIGFFGPPDAEGAVEIGYGLVESARGHGFAGAAVTQVLAIAAANGVKVVRASTEPANHPSSRVLERAGFCELAPNQGLRQFERRLAP